MNDCSVLGARSRNLAGAAVFLLTTVAFAEQQVEVFHGGKFEAVLGIFNAVPAQALKPQPGSVIEQHGSPQPAYSDPSRSHGAKFLPAPEVVTPNAAPAPAPQPPAEAAQAIEGGEILRGILIVARAEDVKPEGVTGVRGVVVKGPDFLRGRDFQELLKGYLGQPLTKANSLKCRLKSGMLPGSRPSHRGCFHK